VLFFLLISDVDRAIFKELKEYVKDNINKEKSRLKPKVDVQQVSPVTDTLDKDILNDLGDNEVTDIDPLEEDEIGSVIRRDNEESKKNHEVIDLENEGRVEHRDESGNIVSIAKNRDKVKKSKVNQSNAHNLDKERQDKISYSSFGNTPSTDKRKSSVGKEKNFSSVKHESSKGKYDSSNKIRPDNKAFPKYQNISKENKGRNPNEVENIDNDSSQLKDSKKIRKKMNSYNDYSSINQFDRNDSHSNIMDVLKKMDSSSNLSSKNNDNKLEVKDHVDLANEKNLNLSNNRKGDDDSRMDEDSF
jgi:hypothetical protein